MTDKTVGGELLNKEEVKSLFESVGAPAEKIEDFVEMFEAAVTAQVDARVEVLVAEKAAELEAKTEAHLTHLNEKAEEFKLHLEGEMSAKVDSYIQHFAEEFVADNKPVVESNVKAALFSSLMGDLIQVFETHNIKLSDEGKDVLAVTEADLATAKTALSEAQAQVIELTRQINEGKKADILAAATSELTESQAEKVRELAADIVFGDTYAEKVQRIAEAIVTGSKATAPKETTDVVTESEQDQKPEDKPASKGMMSAYLTAAKGQAKQFR